ncbi:MAG: aspartate--tRNA(Asn) ligase [Candidatus Saccharibacteria bacterium]|nr:aspartate--tRNA(Asn) ligase [Candidatus Saccharibacteria bacterium]
MNTLISNFKDNMERTLSKDISTQIGGSVMIKGWLHKKRLLGGLAFINVRDRSGLTQIVVEDKDEVEKLRGLQIGTVLEVTGEVVKEERAPGGAELHQPKITVLVPVEEAPAIEIDKPLDHKPENLDTLFEYRTVGLRNTQEAAIFKIRGAITRAIRNHFHENGFTEIQTPKLLASATEGGAEVFKLDYFGQEATLAQSPQFYKQMMVGVFERVYEIAPVYRAEPSATTRHMTEYISVDGEMGFVDIDDIKVFLSGLITSAVDAAWGEYDVELKRWNATKPVLTDVFPSIPMREIHELYEKATKDKITDLKDLTPSEEKWICDYAKKKFGSEAVFVTDWPASEMKFYHKAQADKPEFADRFDLLFRGVEIITGSMRENRYEVVLKQLIEKAKGNPEDPGFKYFLMAMQAGMPDHGGFGMGLERLTQKIIGLSNVKEATLFPRDINRLTP